MAGSKHHIRLLFLHSATWFGKSATIMRIHPLRYFLLTLSILVLASTRTEAQIGFFGVNPGKLFVVNDTADSFDANPGDRVCADSNGRCTLRAAIQEVDAVAVVINRDVIIFSIQQPSEINLTLGEVAITGRRFVSIVGPGARRLTVRRSNAAGTPNFRIFNLSGSQSIHAIRGLTIAGGDPGNEPDGGGIKVGSGVNLTLTEVTITGNAATSGGGVANMGTLEVTRSLFSANSAAGQGGAIHNAQGGSVRISNTTITGSSALMGGGIYNEGGLTLANDTISHNMAATAASGIFNGSSGTVSIINTIVGASGATAVTNLSGAFTSFGNNLITDARNSTGFTAGNLADQVSNNDAVDARLGPLTDNGGQTNTRALLPGSPAINTGNGCVLNGQCNLPQGFPPGLPLFITSDQRRFSRRTFVVFEGLGGGGIDIGAFEAGANQSSSAGSFGAFGIPGFSPAGRSVGTASLRDVITGEKTFSSINPFGSFRFNQPRGGVFNPIERSGIYVLEFNTKRSPQPGPQVIDLEPF